MNYEEYEKACKKLKEENEKYLDLFLDELEKKNLTDKTIRNHYNNVYFYLNDFLQYEEPLNMKEGCNHLNEFFGYFFIRKCMWSTPATIKSTAASLKKFYKFMLENEKIAKEDYQEVCECIKFNMEDWQNTCAIYNDPGVCQEKCVSNF